ncbi:MAG: M1 family metallopeptidase [Clostridiales bacterium]|nr:M1 family metallopeptidase [Clostridiales bacterium]
MRKKLSAVFVALILLATAFAFTGCSQGKEQLRSKYTISATLNADDMTLSATCKIDYVNRIDVELNELKFHLYPAAYRNGAKFSPVSPSESENAYPNGVHYGDIKINEVAGGEWEIGGQDEDVLCVRLNSSIMPTERATVTVDYTLNLPNVRHRLGYDNGTINLGNFFPVECAYDGGFIESPYYAYGDPFNLSVCDFDFTVTAPASFVAACPAPATRTENGTSATTHCTLDNARDFAVVLGKFEQKTATAGSTEITYYYTADAKADEHLQAAVDAVNYFSGTFGAYPYRSYAVVQTAFNQGGMEYTGLVYVSDAAQDKMITEIIVHETAHQWFYGIVGNDQIKHAWQDESLAEYATTLFYEHNPSYGVTYDARIADAMSSLSVYTEMRRNADMSMNRAVYEYDSETEYTFMTYVKGQLLLDSVRTAIGEAKLTAGLKQYTSKYAFCTATPDDLIACLEKASGRELKGLIESFLDGTAKLYAGV